MRAAKLFEAFCGFLGRKFYAAPEVRADD